MGKNNRQTFIGANWKMNTIPEGALRSGSPYRSDIIDLVVLPMSIDLSACRETGIRCGGQAGRSEKTGAFTGDISMEILQKIGASHVLCGHSERRQHHHETDEQIAMQVEAAVAEGLTPILCIGETADQREMDETEEVLEAQLSLLLKSQSSTLNAHNFIVAYEPVWAIGTGKTPTPSEAQTTHAFIRSLLPDPMIRILYGGSMNGQNAAEFLMQPDIDGGLVGGASLKPEEFLKIVEAAKKWKVEGGKLKVKG